MGEFVVLFVCTGNTCRSPMAARLLEEELEREGVAGVKVVSAGTAVVPGAAATREAHAALADRGLSLESHRARQLSRDLLARADLVLTMTTGHRDHLLDEYGGGLEDKTFVLREYALGDTETQPDDQAGWDITDPYGLGVEEYRATADELRTAVTAALPRLLDEVRVKREVSTMVIGIGSDHAGYNLKLTLIDFLRQAGHEVIDVGTNSTDSVDYPDFAEKVARGVAGGRFERGILICGTGIGMSMAANKVPGVRAALCHDVFSARATREDNDANVLTMGARVVGRGLAMAILEAWLGAKFQGGRHARRVSKLMALEEREDETNGG